MRYYCNLPEQQKYTTPRRIWTLREWRNESFEVRLLTASRGDRTLEIVDGKDGWIEKGVFFLSIAEARDLWAILGEALGSLEAAAREHTAGTSS